MKVKAVIVDKRTGEVIEAFPSIESANAHLALEVFTLRNAEKMILKL
ncbi:MAG: hypothetical protein MJ237_08385 [bacterium]|nr:hypothetical protein [bacterium]